MILGQVPYLSQVLKVLFLTVYSNYLIYVVHNHFVLVKTIKDLLEIDDLKVKFFPGFQNGDVFTR